MSEASSKKIARKKLIAISRWLGNIPSLAYALFYLLMIPLFATIYYFLPYHFYHSTIQYEHSFYTEVHNTEEMLTKEILDRFEKAHHSYEINTSRWKIKIKLPGGGLVRFLQVSGNEISFRMLFLITDSEKESSSELAQPLIRFQLIPKSYPLDSKYIGEGFIFNRNLLIDELTDNLLVTPTERVEIARAIFPFDYEGRPSESIILYISNKIESCLQKISSASKGFPSSISGNFVRMFYLSAVTITTLGYGDVIPITTTSRILVSFEAILGLVLIGLFLNALWYEGKSEGKS